MKRDEVGEGYRQDDWLGATLRQPPATPSETCLDAETLSAWVSGTLRGRAAAAVELHASSCSRCMAVLAAMERSAPAARAGAFWTPARLFRWLAPLAAAATAVAVWVVVPDRPIAPVEPAPAHEITVPQPRGATPEPGTAKQDAEPGTQNQNAQAPPQTLTAPSARLEEREPEYVDRLKREDRADHAGQALGVAGGAAAAPAPPAAIPESAPRAAAPSARAADTAATRALNETIAVAPQQRSFAARMTITSEALSPVNQLVRWRVVDAVSVERSIDGGKTWTRTIQIPGVEANTADALTIVSIRAVDDVTAIVRTSDGRDFVTSNGGLAWTPAVQEKPAAPF